MANKRFVNPNDIDENLIRDLVDSATDYKQNEKVLLSKISNQVANNLGINPTLDYRRIFLKPVKIGQRCTFHLDVTTKKLLEIVLQRLGDGQTNLPAFVDNILRHHLETFKDAINNLSKNHSDIL